jgi:hypothetical protein
MNVTIVPSHSIRKGRPITLIFYYDKNVLIPITTETDIDEVSDFFGELPITLDDDDCECMRWFIKKYTALRTIPFLISPTFRTRHYNILFVAMECLLRNRHISKIIFYDKECDEFNFLFSDLPFHMFMKRIIREYSLIECGHVYDDERIMFKRGMVLYKPENRQLYDLAVNGTDVLYVNSLFILQQTSLGMIGVNDDNTVCGTFLNIRRTSLVNMAIDIYSKGSGQKVIIIYQACPISLHHYLLHKKDNGLYVRNKRRHKNYFFFAGDEPRDIGLKHDCEMYYCSYIELYSDTQ